MTINIVYKDLVEEKISFVKSVSYENNNLNILEFGAETHKIVDLNDVLTYSCEFYDKVIRNGCIRTTIDLEGK